MLDEEMKERKVRWRNESKKGGKKLHIYLDNKAEERSRRRTSRLHR